MTTTATSSTNPPGGKPAGKRPSKFLTHVQANIPQPASPWLGSLRDKAAASLASAGLPTRKDEAWRFTPLDGVTDQVFADAPEVAERKGEASLKDIHAWLEQALGDDDTHRLVMLNGRLMAPENGQHGDSLPDGIDVVPLAADMGLSEGISANLSEALRGKISQYLGKIARLEHFAALNAAMFGQVVLVHIGRDAQLQRPLHLVHAGVASSGPTVAYPRILVVAEAGSQATIIESALVHPDADERHLANAVVEIAVEERAHLRHVRCHYGSKAGRHIANVAVRQYKDAAYTSQVVTLGGALTRLDLDISMMEPGAECTLLGAYHADSGERMAHHTVVDHWAANCSSNERYRGIADGNGHAVFDGTAIVRPNAQHSDAHQENRNLLLSDDAVIHTKPHLRIDADDVSCSHGATIGSLDEDQVFYMRARGVDEDRARAVLTYAFVRDIINTIDHAPLAERLALAVRERLPHGDLLED